MEEKKISGNNNNTLEENIHKLKNLFPEIVTDGKIDFEKLKIILGEAVDESEERYDFSWFGKLQSVRESQKLSTGTLRPIKNESKQWDKTENLYIKGDNLEVLKILQKSYNGQIKFIYIDPPYNTGSDFIYSDDHRDNIKNYFKVTGQLDSDQNKKSTNLEKDGRYHTNWLNMIYPRLKLSRNLLCDDGVIFISIDDNEIENLKKICNEIFGEDNFVGQWNWFKSETPPNLSYKIKKNIEYILCYQKIKNSSKFKGLKKVSKSDDPMTKPQNSLKNLTFKPFTLNIKSVDQVIKKGTYGTSKFPNILLNDLIVKDNKNFNEVTFKNKFIWVQEKLDKEIRKGTKINLSKNLVLSFKKSNYDNEVPPNFIDSKIGSTTEKAGKEIINLFGFKIFDYPKPTELITYLMSFINLENEIILDFFSGTATTAHAVMFKNALEKTNNKFIMVQLEELCDDKSKAYEAGYTDICEIGKERIRCAGDKIIKESDNKDLDIGFKVFKLDSSNLEKWDPHYDDDLEQTLLIQNNNIKTDRTEEDLIYEIMLKYGLGLTLPIEKYNDIYSVGYGSLLICLSNNITKDITKDILKLKEKFDPEVIRVVFKDNGFKSDSDKTNIKETLKVNKIDEFITI